MEMELEKTQTASLTYPVCFFKVFFNRVWVTIESCSNFFSRCWLALFLLIRFDLLFLWCFSFRFTFFNLRFRRSIFFGSRLPCPRPCVSHSRTEHVYQVEPRECPWVTAHMWLKSTKFFKFFIISSWWLWSAKPLCFLQFRFDLFHHSFWDVSIG